jgi:hypothetical protein
MLLLMLPIISRGQKVDSDSLVCCNGICNNSYSCGWVLAKEGTKITGTVLSFSKKMRSCGVERHAAVAFVFNDGDTVRAILPCYRGEIAVGQHVTISALNVVDNKSELLLPFDHSYLKRTTIEGRPLFRINAFDERIKATVIGSIVR